MIVSQLLVNKRRLIGKDDFPELRTLPKRKNKLLINKTTANIYQRTLM